MKNRYLQNLFTTRWALHRAFPRGLLNDIDQAIHASEQQHGAELRFAIETALDTSSLMRGCGARARALQVFSSLGIWDTQANNGVLIYLLLSEHAIEIVADRGYNGKVSAQQWQAVCDAMREQFQSGHYREGVLRGIAMITALVSQYFPPDPNDRNELPNRPVLV
jgi:uncharacterized membrane protein YgcG